MITLRLLALMFLTVGTAAAQDRAIRPISTESNESVPREDGDAPMPAVGAVPSVSVAPIPDAPAPHGVIDKKFVFVMAALGGAETVRFTSRKLVLDHELAAGAPWVRNVPGNQHLVAKYAGLYAAELLVAYEMKKPHSWLPGDRIIRKLWWAYPAAMAIVHAKNGVGNIRTQGPGGCTSMECAMQTQTQ